MSDDKAITVDRISKCYLVGHEGAARGPHGSLRESLARDARALARKTRDMARGRQIVEGDRVEEFWALRDVSFEVGRGEVVGIIGRNGAGKSTLLKILSRITEPTSGRARILGRVASLLEVGTGFHPELTGRENVFLNGSILGMSRDEIRKKFDEIVTFSGVEQFIDTPVKRYSSGMQVRLAFSVAAHLEPEILLIDEVLAVGDLGFQRKAMSRMSEVSEKQDITVLCVSHNMAAVMNLCPKSILLENGRLKFHGRTDECVEIYRRDFMELTETGLGARTDRIGDGSIRFTEAWVENAAGERDQPIPSGQPLRIVAQFKASRSGIRSFQTAFALYTSNGMQITDLWSKSVGCEWDDVPESGSLVCTLPRVPLAAGRYRFNVFARVANVVADAVEGAGYFEIVEADFFGSGVLPSRHGGSVLVEQEWRLEQ